MDKAALAAFESLSQQLDTVIGLLEKLVALEERYQQVKLTTIGERVYDFMEDE